MNESNVLTTEEEILNRYRKAFYEANGKPADQIWHTGHGWYKMRGYGAKRRLKTFIEWAERLEARPHIAVWPPEGVSPHRDVVA
jgi:hypothetical protein